MRSRVIVLTLFLTFAAAAAASAQTTLSFTMWGNQAQRVVYESLAAEFAASDPEIDAVDVIQIPHGQYRDRLAVSTAGGSPPDVMLLDGFYSKEAFAAGWTLDLERFLAEGSVDVDDFFEPFWDGATYDGRRYGLPCCIGGGFRTDVFAVNRNMFEEAGLVSPLPTESPSQDAWTIAEFVEIVQTLTIDVDGDGTLDQWGFAPGRWFPWVFSNGGEILTDNRSRCALAEPAAVEAIQILGDLRFQTQVSNRRGFADGRVGVHQLVFPSTGSVRSLVSRGGAFDWFLAHQPRGAAGSVGYAKMNVVSVARETDHPDAAWRLAQFIAGPRSAEVQALNQVSAPWRISVARSAEFLRSDEPPYNMAPNVFGESFELPVVIDWNRIYSMANQAIGTVNRGESAAEPAMQELCRQVDSILAERAAQGPLY